MKTLTDFALKNSINFLNLLEISLLKFIPELIGKRFVLFLSLCILTKPFQKGDLKLMSL